MSQTIATNQSSFGQPPLNGHGQTRPFSAPSRSPWAHLPALGPHPYRSTNHANIANTTYSFLNPAKRAMRPRQRPHPLEIISVPAVKKKKEKKAPSPKIIFGEKKTPTLGNIRVPKVRVQCQDPKARIGVPNQLDNTQFSLRHIFIR